MPRVRGSQSQARDISLPKLYNGKAMAWRVTARASRSLNTPDKIEKSWFPALHVKYSLHCG